MLPIPKMYTGLGQRVPKLTFLNVVVGQSAAIFELFTGKNQTLLIGRNSLLVLDLRLDIFNGVRRLNLESDGLARQSFDENLHFDCKKNVNK